MMRGHNRPPFLPRLPGTGLPSPDVPTAIIYRPSRPATTSGPRPRHWVLEFLPARPPRSEPLMGWTSSDDPYRPIRMTFPDRDSAIAFAESQDWDYILRDDPARQPPRPKRQWWQSSPMHKGADMPGAHRLTPRGRAISRHKLYRGVEAEGAHAMTRAAAQPDFDPVLEADLESFPASDPPAWTGVTLAARGKP